jgi:hypothetical protein
MSKPSSPIADSLRQFARNGRWGTCVECPRADGQTFIEFCENTDRYDHQLTWDSLKAQVDREF